jgi:hypothetical protein
VWSWKSSKKPLVVPDLSVDEVERLFAADEFEQVWAAVTGTEHLAAGRSRTWPPANSPNRSPRRWNAVSPLVLPGSTRRHA